MFHGYFSFVERYYAIFLGVTCSSLSSINFARASLQKSSKYEKIGVERFLQRSLYYWLIQKS